jgi:Leucine-rich repeat (LRR) protein
LCYCTKIKLLFQEIPETVGNLKQLVTLKLDDNQLTTFPKTVGKLSNLEELVLNQNDFETLPPCIGLLRKLSILNVDDNILEELPPGKAFLCSSHFMLLGLITQIMLMWSTYHEAPHFAVLSVLLLLPQYPILKHS